jgi:hypothetical protein
MPTPTFFGQNQSIVGGGGCGLLSGAPTTNLQFDHVGACLTGNDGDAITAWVDSSAAANDLGTFAGGPTKENNVINGLAVAKCNGDDNAIFSTPIAVTSGFTYIAVLNPTDFTGQRSLIAGPSGSVQVRFNGAKINLLKCAVADMGSSSTILSIGTFYTIGVTYDGTTVRFYLNGSADGTSTTSQTFTADITRIWVNPANGSETGHCELAEHLLWSSVLSGGDLTTVFNALRTKYAHY